MFDLEQFCQNIFGKGFDEIKENINKEDYSSFVIPKKRGMRQIIALPKNSELRRMQKLLLDKFFANYSLPIPAKGFAKQESYKNYLMPHIGANYFLRIDISNFFNSIKFEHVEELLKDLFVFMDKDEKSKLIDLIWDIVSYNDSIPQGGVTSPIISNLIFRKLDQRILKYCQLFDIEYTRYADDLLFSSYEFNFMDKKWFLKKIKHILGSRKFRINYRKIKYGYKEISLNGFIVSNRDIRLSRSRLFDIRHIVSYIRNNEDARRKDKCLLGINNLRFKHYDIEKYPFKSYYRVIQFLCGYRSFIISWIDDCIPNIANQKKLRKLVNEIEKAINILSEYI